MTKGWFLWSRESTTQLATARATGDGKCEPKSARTTGIGGGVWKKEAGPSESEEKPITSAASTAAAPAIRPFWRGPSLRRLPGVVSSLGRVIYSPLQKTRISIGSRGGPDGALGDRFSSGRRELYGCPL